MIGMAVINVKFLVVCHGFTLAAAGAAALMPGLGLGLGLRDWAAAVLVMVGLDSWAPLFGES